MKKSKMGIFEKEERILEFITSINFDKISKEEFEQNWKTLTKNYSSLLKQTSRLTKYNDRQNAKLRKIEKRLKKYVPHQLYQNIMKGHELAETYKTVRKNLTVFFSDIKNFSIITSAMDGETLSTFLNDYLEEMTIIVNKHGGTLDKYIGDSVMVFFGAPRDSSKESNVEKCIKMSLEMREKMKEIRKKWYLMGYEQPFHIRIGIATGYCMVGNFGSSQRMDYTISGRTANLAARLEQCAEVDEILLCHSTWGIAKDYIECNPPEEKNLKGFQEPKITHQLIDIKDIDNKKIFNFVDEGAEIKIDKTKFSKEYFISLIDSIYD